MILTCPECDTRYFIDAARVGSQGRMVRCSQCATSWRAGAPSGDEEPALRLDLDASTPVEAEVEALTSTPLPRTFREEVQARRRTREAVAAGVVWAGLAAGIALVVAGALLFRVDMVRLWPAAAGAYAFAHLPVNPTGFTVEGVQGGPGLQDGRLAMIVAGAQRNVEAGPRAAPALQVSLLDKAGHKLAIRLVPAPTGRVPAGEARAFRVSFLDPPSAAAQIGVDIAFDFKSPAAKPKAPARAPAARSGAGAPPGLVRVEMAKPLPANSPYALPASAGAQQQRSASGVHG